MGRGKKKGDKKTEEVGKELSAPEAGDQPSTSSTTASALAIEEEFEGLGLGGGRKKKKSKATTALTKDVEEKAPENPTEISPEAKETEEKPITDIKEEEVGLGLGLSKGKKRNAKKKTEKVPAATPETVPVVIPGAVPVVTSGTVPVATPGTVPPQLIHSVPKFPQNVPQQPSVQSSWGRGRGQPKSGPMPVDPRPQFKPEIFQDKPSQSTAQGQKVPIQYTSLPHSSPKELTKGQAKALSKEFASVRYAIPDKIWGTTVRARPIEVLTNYLAMRIIKPLKIHRYDVQFVPDKPKLFLPKVFRAVVAQYFPKEYLAFDQMKNCYSLQLLPKKSNDDRIQTSVEITDMNGKVMKFDVTFKHTGIVDLGTIDKFMKNRESSILQPTEAIQCVDVILKQGTLESYVRAGRQYFKRPSRPISLGDGLEMWTGLFQSAIFTDRAFINIDVAHKGFPKEQMLTEALENDFRLTLDRPIEQQRGRGVDAFLDFIKGLRVIVKVFGKAGASDTYRQFICNGIVDAPAKKTFPFTGDDGRTRNVTVAQYFKIEKKYNIRYPNLNCMWVGPKEKGIFYPMELLRVAYGQARNKQLNDMQLSTMVRMAATPPDDRMQKIQEVIREMNYSKNPFFTKFGFEIADHFFPVEARVLEPPNLEIGIQRTIMPRNGSWQANSLLKPEALLSWGFIAIESDPSRCNFDNMIQMIMNTGRQIGMNVSKPAMHHFNVRINEMRSLLFSALEKDIKFLFVIISARGRNYYQMVKQWAERDVGILTQCVKEQTAANRMNPQTVRNILLKVNSKLMGINQALDGRSTPRCLKGGGVMIVGADVTHPSPDQSNIPSIAAVTASIDPKCYLYNIELSIQTPKKEMIVEFEDMMVDHFNVFKKHNGMLPKKIYVFRDGVSEGQFSQVMESELNSIHRAYQRLMGPNTKPEILFLLVQKRHHTRFFCKSNLKNNVEPGTVVDKHIVHARELDFYLVSHQAIKGTARPTRYHAVCNDGGIPHDEVEQLTYYLCHLYSRCMRAVSYPTPTYYAHLACLRARSLTHGETFNNNELETKPKRLRVLDRMLEKSRMFFV